MSESRELIVEKNGPGMENALSKNGLPPSISKPALSDVELEGFGIGL
jgi:hypothetical protein